MLQLGRQPRRKLGHILTPELRDFLDRAIVPALVDAYLSELGGDKGLARSTAAGADCARKMSPDAQVTE